MKHLYAINILQHPYLKSEEQVKNLFNILTTTNNWIVNEGESYVIRRTLSGSWVWDKMTRNTIDIGGRLYDNKWVEKFNTDNFNQVFYEVGRNPNKGFLMIGDTLWGLCQFDVSIKGRNLKRLKVPDQILHDIAKQIGFAVRQEYKYLSNIYYVDQNGIQDNLQGLTQQTDKLIVNFDESFKIPIYISKQMNLIESNKEEC